MPVGVWQRRAWPATGTPQHLASLPSAAQVDLKLAELVGTDFAVQAKSVYWLDLHNVYIVCIHKKTRSGIGTYGYRS